MVVVLSIHFHGVILEIPFLNGIIGMKWEDFDKFLEIQIHIGYNRNKVNCPVDLCYCLLHFGLLNILALCILWSVNRCLSTWTGHQLAYANTLYLIDL